MLLLFLLFDSFPSDFNELSFSCAKLQMPRTSPQFTSPSQGHLETLFWEALFGEGTKWVTKERVHPKKRLKTKWINQKRPKKSDKNKVSKKKVPKQRIKKKVIKKGVSNTFVQFQNKRLKQQVPFLPPFFLP